MDNYYENATVQWFCSYLSMKGFFMKTSFSVKVIFSLHKNGKNNDRSKLNYTNLSHRLAVPTQGRSGHGNHFSKVGETERSFILMFIYTELYSAKN